ncbi:tail fiber assembly protein [Citrobacter freundii]|uniref:tail fiber assembly protein n=1 Tax=Citrobacter TaxID=544 RepID=UPI001749E037|nr:MULTISPECIES: tail fiber assembly protein [Citrobacter]EIM2944558.1 tail fiber assembly protein [Escherichia coli]ELL8663975.1 tail fiber assembly protein [Citrobacter freundii]MBY5089799.1 tail fiber assembly protein [Citrobacter freundii]MDM2921445.1 tail fiber assembly protein [Citrobacter sp. Cpo032]NTZ34321.1 tail fiber assembly protein [Citrobacter freundii]
MNIYFSASIPAFIPAQWKEDGTYDDDTWPADAVLLSDEESELYWKQNPPAGKQLGTENGRPVWIDIPAPTQDELIADAEREKQRRIDAANEFMNSKQWPGKAAIGRLKGDELAQYNLWLDYLDALDAVKTTSAPDIKWPTPPGEQAS